MSDKNTDAAASRQARTRAAVAYVMVGILTTLLLSGAKLIFEHSSRGQEIELGVFGWLQGSLSSIDPDNPIMVVDITGIPGGKDGPTPRKNLQEIINALADQRPRAIAVDVEFSPKPGTDATRDDVDFFFDSCLDVKNKKGVPVFLAVGDNKAAGPEAWLGQEEYKDLAVAVAANEDDPSRLPLWVKAKDSSERLKTMSYALALEYRKHLPEAPSWIRWAVDRNVEGRNEETHHEEADSPLTYSDRLVNYSKLDQIKGASQSDITAESIRQTGERYKNKVVILGDVAIPMDAFPVPGRNLNAAGSLVIACATYTLIREPLFELKSTVRLLLDFFIAGIIITMVAIIVYRNRDSRIWVGRQALFIYVALAGVLMTGWLLVIVAGVMWMDFIFLAGALFLHPKVEHLIRKIFKRKKVEPSTDPSSDTVAAVPSSETDAAVVKVAVCVGAILIGLVSTAKSQEPARLCEQRVAAVAVNLNLNPKKRKNTCHFRDKKAATGKPLSQADSKKKQFRAGQQIYCDKGCSLVILLCGSRKEETVSKNLPDWYPVLNAAASAPLIDQYPDNLRRRAQLFTPANPSTTDSEASKRRRMSGFWSGYLMRDSRPLSSATPEADDRLQSSAAKPSAGSQKEAPASRPPRNESAAASMPTGERPAPITTTETLAKAKDDLPSEDKKKLDQLVKEQRMNAEIAAFPRATPATETPKSERAEATAAAANTALSTADKETAKVSRDQELSKDGSLGAFRRATRPRTISGAEMEQQRQFLDLLRAGNTARAAKDFAVAKKSYSEAAALIPDDPRGFQGMGNVEADQGKWRDAEAAYRQAYLLAPDMSKTLLALGVVLLQPVEGNLADRLSEAETYFWRATAIDPRNEAAYALLDAILEKRGASLEEVESFYRRVVADRPNSAYASLGLSKSLLALGRKKEVEQYLYKAEKIASGPSEVLAVAEAFESQHRYARVERLLRRVLESNPNDARVLYSLGRVLVLRQYYSKALEPLELAVVASREELAPVYLLGIAQFHTKKLTDAEQTLEKAASKAPAGGNELLRIAYQLARVGDDYAAAGRLQDAARLYEKALKCDPQDLEIQDKLAEARKKSIQ